MYKRGVIILTPYPFSDLSGNKVRPAIVIGFDSRDSDVTVLFITSKQSKKLYKNDVLIDPYIENGLKQKSVVRCNKIATLDKKIILGEIGSLSKSDLNKINKKLKDYFGL